MKSNIIVSESKCQSNNKGGKLEETSLKRFESLNVEVDPKVVEDCRWLQNRNGCKKVIIKLPKRKDGNKIRQVKNKLKSLNLETMGISSPIVINDSLCPYYKKLWDKYKKLQLNKYIHGFWVS